VDAKVNLPMFMTTKINKYCGTTIPREVIKLLGTKGGKKIVLTFEKGKTAARKRGGSYVSKA